RTIREEIDAMKVIGVNPVQALVVPRIMAATFVALLLYSVVAVVGLTGSYIFVVFVQHVTPGAFIAGMTLLTGLPQVIVSLVKATLFGLSAGLIACYKGLSVGGGPTAVGNAVNETVVFAFMALFLINIVATAFGVKVAPWPLQKRTRPCPETGAGLGWSGQPREVKLDNARRRR